MKTLFDLQLFAEAVDGQTTEGAAGTNDAAENEEQSGQAVERRYTDADVDRIIDRKFAEWQKKQQKAVDEAKKLERMSAQQKAEYERDQLQKALDEYKRKDSLAEMTKTARKMLTDSGIAVPDELLSVLVTTDADQTKAAIDSFSGLFAAAVETAVKERLRGEPPKKGASTGQSMTKEQIMAIRDPELRQKKMLEHRGTFQFLRRKPDEQTTEFAAFCGG